jgi:hypothetical protein
MTEFPKRLKWAALCLASLFCIGTGAALDRLAKDGIAGHAPTHGQTGANPDAACEIDPQRIC